jgi:hypothetical protein
LTIGALCRPCALQVAPCDGLIPDHLHSRVDDGAAAAWVVDGFGAMHALRSTSTVGRNLDGEVVILASSVSRAHAELRSTGTQWLVRDLGSRNGTFVDGVRCRGEAALPARAVVRLGDVSLWFLAQLVDDPPSLSLVTTTAGAGGGTVRYELTHPTAELCIFAADGATAGGALMWRASAGDRWSERGLAPLEFQLLRTLCAHARAEAASPSRVRGCVSTEQLVRELPFQSRYANQDNVRQIVMRLRSVLADVGARGVLAVAPRRGYYLACQVSAAG